MPRFVMDHEHLFRISAACSLLRAEPERAANRERSSEVQSIAPHTFNRSNADRKHLCTFCIATAMWSFLEASFDQSRMRNRSRKMKSRIRRGIQLHEKQRKSMRVRNT
ncbi:MAG: hypothetical protein AB7E80_11545 [Hyphomicrobiaceae bacterium]